MKKFRVILFFACVAISSNLISISKKLAALTHDERQMLYAKKFKYKRQEEINFDVTPLRCIVLLLLAGSGHCAATIFDGKQQPVMDESLVEPVVEIYKNYEYQPEPRFKNNSQRKSKIFKNPSHR